MLDIFKLRSEQTYNLRQSSQFFTPRVSSVSHGKRKCLVSGAQILDSGTKQIKKLSNSILKSYRKWSPEKCPCKFFKIFVSNVGFV